MHAPQATRRPLPGQRLGEEEHAHSHVKQEVGANNQQEEHQSGGAQQDDARNVEIEIIEHPVQEQQPELPELPRLPRLGAIDTPRRPSHLDVEADAERLTSSAVRGGVASAMLSLSRS